MLPGGHLVTGYHSVEDIIKMLAVPTLDPAFLLKGLAGRFSLRFHLTPGAAIKGVLSDLRPPPGPARRPRGQAQSPRRTAATRRAPGGSLLQSFNPVS